MRFFDWLVVIVMGVVGWLVVSFLLNRSKPQGDDAADDSAARAGTRADGSEDAEFPTMPRIPGPTDAFPTSAGRGVRRRPIRRAQRVQRFRRSRPIPIAPRC